MKKYLLGIILLISLVACKQDTSPNNPILKGRVIDIDNRVALLELEEDQALLSSGQRVSIYIGYTGHKQIKLGDRLMVTYQGEVMESDPLQVQVVSVLLENGKELEILEADDKYLFQEGVFEGRVVEVYEGDYLLELTHGENWILAYGHMMISLEQVLEVGQVIEVTFDGSVMESDPPQVEVQSYRLIP